MEISAAGHTVAVQADDNWHQVAAKALYLWHRTCGCLPPHHRTERGGTQMKPTVGRIVHYVSHGTPPRSDGSQAFTAQCRAAVVTEVGDNDVVGLCVLNPTGQFFHSLAAGGCHHQENERAGGSWHWPEREG
ncbi:hypothetical protein [Micromonospora sediminicola]|uniref:hypothetical protein n=1 Tax=Micromonospora sediminicola TaxID=946078 RepID=UPI00379B1D8C